MALRSRRFGRGDPEVMLDINTTPLIDVMLVLLVMLIITIPIQLHAVHLEMPVGVPPSVAPPAAVRIDIDDAGVVHWQGEPLAAAQLDARLAAIARQPVPPDVHVRPSSNCSYAVFAKVLSASRRAGLTKVAVIGSEQFAK